MAWSQDLIFQEDASEIPVHQQLPPAPFSKVKDTEQINLLI